MMEDITSDFVYLRLHGAEELYASGYTEKALDEWARKLSAWSIGRDAYVYFDNDVKVRAPYDAMSLARKLDVAIHPKRMDYPEPGKEMPGSFPEKSARPAKKRATSGP